MTLINRFLITAAAMSFMAQETAIFSEEVAIPSEVESTALTDDAGWYIVTTDKFTIHFPAKPKVDTKGATTTYSSLDSANFPVVMYSFTENTSKTPIDAEQQVNDHLEKLSTHPLNLLHHEVTESANEIIVDTLCSDAKTRVMRCERMIIAKDNIHTMTTLFFPGSAENHEYFVQHFTAL